MRKLRQQAAIAACALGWIAAPASAEVVRFEGIFTFEIAGLPAISLTTDAGLAMINDSAGGPHVDGLTLPVPVFGWARATAPVTDVEVWPIAGLQLSGDNSPPGSYRNGTASLPWSGLAKVCLFANCAAATANLSVPFTGAVGGGTNWLTGDDAVVTVVGAPWTTGTVTVPTPRGGVMTRQGLIRGPGGGLSSTGSPSGVLQLVTPVLIQTNLDALPSLAAIATFRLHFVPEPGTLILLGAGVVALSAAGCRTLR